MPILIYEEHIILDLDAEHCRSRSRRVRERVVVIQLDRGGELRDLGALAVGGGVAGDDEFASKIADAETVSSDELGPVVGLAYRDALCGAERIAGAPVHDQKAPGKTSEKPVESHRVWQECSVLGRRNRSVCDGGQVKARRCCGGAAAAARRGLANIRLQGGKIVSWAAGHVDMYAHLLILAVYFFILPLSDIVRPSVVFIVRIEVPLLRGFGGKRCLRFW